MDSTDAQRAEFGAALARQLEGKSRPHFAVQVADESGETVSNNAIILWLSGKSEPTRAKVFAMERVLGVKPGTLSRRLGYLPVDAKATASVLDAIESDPLLGERDRRTLVTLYRELTRSS